MNLVKYKKVKAKKEHKCDFCGEAIEKGEEHYYSFCVNGNEHWNWRSHERCEDIAQALQMYRYCNEEGLNSDSFKDSINDYCQYELAMNNEEVFEMSYKDKIIVIKNHIESENKQ